MPKKSTAKAAKVEEEVKAPEAVVPPANDPADDLDKQIDAETKAPEGVKVGKPGVPANLAVRTDKDGVKTIAPTGRFESVDNLIFNEFGQHCGSEANASDAAKKAGSFNTQRKFR